jgi:hypothetical protein
MLPPRYTRITSMPGMLLEDFFMRVHIRKVPCGRRNSFIASVESPDKTFMAAITGSRCLLHHFAPHSCCYEFVKAFTEALAKHQGLRTRQRENLNLWALNKHSCLRTFVTGLAIDENFLISATAHHCTLRPAILSQASGARLPARDTLIHAVFRRGVVLHTRQMFPQVQRDASIVAICTGLVQPYIKKQEGKSATTLILHWCRRQNDKQESFMTCSYANVQDTHDDVRAGRGNAQEVLSRTCPTFLANLASKAPWMNSHECKRDSCQPDQCRDRRQGTLRRGTLLHLRL